jgi:hypothetical protein
LLMHLHFVMHKEPVFLANFHELLSKCVPLCIY